MWQTTRGKNSPPIEGAAVIDEIIQNIRERFEEISISANLQKHLDNNPPEIQMPAVWGDHDGERGPMPEDPLELRVYLPFGANEDEPPYWTISLVDVLEEDIEDARADGSYSKGLLRIADALTALAEKIKAATGAHI